MQQVVPRCEPQAARRLFFRSQSCPVRFATPSIARHDACKPGCSVPRKVGEQFAQSFRPRGGHPREPAQSVSVGIVTNVLVEGGRELLRAEKLLVVVAGKRERALRIAENLSAFECGL